MKTTIQSVFLTLALFMIAISAAAAKPSVSVRYLKAPAVSGIGASPLMKLTLRGLKPGCKVGQVTLKLSQPTDCYDLESVAIYPPTAEDKKSGNGVNMDSSKPLGTAEVTTANASKLTIATPTVTSEADSLELWVAAKIRDGVDLSHHIRANVESVKTSCGTIRPASRRPGSWRMGVAVRQSGQDGVHTSRIPAIATTNSGTLIALFDARYDSKRDLQGNIDIAIQRSTDGGRTWQPLQRVLDMGCWGGLPEKYNGVSDAGILVDRQTGDILIAGLWMHGALDDDGRWIEGLNEKSDYWIHQWKKRGSQPGTGLRQTCQFLITRSTDDGQTWGFPQNITQDTKRPEWWLFAPAPGQGLMMADGTLVFPTQGRDAKGLPFSNVTYSRDHGRTWTTSKPAYSNCTECNAAELEPGTLMLNMRDNRNRGVKSPNGRRIMTTNDLGQNWTEHPTSYSVLTEPTCMASLYKHYYTDANGQQQPLLLFANPAHHKIRKNLTLRASLDLGQTWPEDCRILFDETRSMAYSSITAVDPQTIGILYESGLANLVFIQIPLSEILPPESR